MSSSTEKDHTSPLTPYIPKEQYDGPSDFSPRENSFLIAASLAFILTIGMIVQTPDEQPVLLKVCDLVTRPLATAVREGDSILRISSAGYFLKSKLGLTE